MRAYTDEEKTSPANLAREVAGEIRKSGHRGYAIPGPPQVNQPAYSPDPRLADIARTAIQLINAIDAHLA
jgi:hypothetical protein